jgi:hypothetical protein
MERELNGFIRKANWEGKKAKNELKKRIKECMQLRKIGMCEVMKDKAMEDGFNTWMTNHALKEKWRRSVKMVFLGMVLCNNKHQDA